MQWGEAAGLRCCRQAVAPAWMPRSFTASKPRTPFAPTLFTPEDIQPNLRPKAFQVRPKPAPEGPPLARAACAESPALRESQGVPAVYLSFPLAPKTHGFGFGMKRVCKGLEYKAKQQSRVNAKQGCPLQLHLRRHCKLRDRRLGWIAIRVSRTYQAPLQGSSIHPTEHVPVTARPGASVLRYTNGLTKLLFLDDAANMHFQLHKPRSDRT